MRRASSNRRLAALLVAGVLALGGVALLVLGGGSEARSQLADFLGHWEGERYADAATLADGPEPEVAQALEQNVNGLDGATLETEITEFDEDGDEARGEVRKRWEIPVVGTFEYTSEVPLRQVDGEWRVIWSPAVVHPELDEGERLGTVRDFPERAPILDRDGRELVSDRPVVDVGIVPGDADDLDAAIAAIADQTAVDRRRLRRSVRAAGQQQFVVAITLREPQAAPVREALGDVPGVQFAERTMPLARSRRFARALLGTVGPITEEQLESLGEPYGVGDAVGQWGLQAAFERQLAGTPTARVIVRNADGVPVRTLHEVEGSPGEPLRTTLDRGAQEAAEAALGDRGGRAALVAVDPTRGDILAVANRPVGNVFNRGLEGQYPPGSTFKVVSTAALLDAGLDTGETVDCPPRIEVAGREFRNFEGGAQGAVPFRVDFVESCNTAFVSLADRIEPGALPQTAERFGLGLDYELPVEHFAGSVPEPRNAVERAAAIIGQGRTLASPLAMSGVAATVGAGRWHQPRLLRSDPRDAGDELDAQTRETLRSLMRQVVESGTGSAASGVSGLAGKTGTAEYGTGDPPPTHAWFIGVRDDTALAVLVEDAPSGGEVAAPIAAAFFAARDG